jgi:hypothetical protein
MWLAGRSRRPPSPNPPIEPDEKPQPETAALTFLRSGLVMPRWQACAATKTDAGARGDGRGLLRHAVRRAGRSRNHLAPADRPGAYVAPQRSRRSSCGQGRSSCRWRTLRTRRRLTPNASSPPRNPPRAGRPGSVNCDCRQRPADIVATMNVPQFQLPPRLGIGIEAISGGVPRLEQASSLVCHNAQPVVVRATASDG